MPAGANGQYDRFRYESYVLTLAATASLPVIAILAISTATVFVARKLSGRFLA